MNHNSLPVSRRFYNDISLRITDALSSSPASASEARRMVDAYMAGETPQSNDAMAMLAFGMIKTEIDRAMSRSKRARERAKARKSEEKTEPRERNSLPPTEQVPDTTSETDPEPVAERHVSRRERRAALNRIRRLTKPRWGAIA